MNLNQKNSYYIGNNNEPVIVNDKLKTTYEKDIFAFGDCESYLQIDRHGKTYYVRPRAQAAHQQAKSFKNHFMQMLLLAYRYKDYGSSILLSEHNVLGNLMSKVAQNFLHRRFIGTIFLLIAL